MGGLGEIAAKVDVEAARLGVSSAEIADKVEIFLHSFIYDWSNSYG